MYNYNVYKQNKWNKAVHVSENAQGPSLKATIFCNSQLGKHQHNLVKQPTRQSRNEKTA